MKCQHVNRMMSIYDGIDHRVQSKRETGTILVCPSGILTEGQCRQCLPSIGMDCLLRHFSCSC